MPSSLQIQDALKLVGRQLAVGLGRIGARATAAAYKQVSRDIEAGAAEVQRRAAGARKKLEDLIGVEQDPDRP